MATVSEGHLASAWGGQAKDGRQPNDQSTELCTCKLLASSCPDSGSDQRTKSVCTAALIKWKGANPRTGRHQPIEWQRVTSDTRSKGTNSRTVVLGQVPPQGPPFVVNFAGWSRNHGCACNKKFHEPHRVVEDLWLRVQSARTTSVHSGVSRSARFLYVRFPSLEHSFFLKPELEFQWVSDPCKVTGSPKFKSRPTLARCGDLGWRAQFPGGLVHC